MGDWNPRANDIFLKAIEAADSAGQNAVLDAECAGDTALRLDVEALLSGHQQTAGILENPPTDSFLKSIADAPVLERVGSVIGPYKLVAVIGEGGMGTVFRADQAVPVRRTVAVKVIKAGMDTRKVVARFEAERQTLAVMDHPNIAKVLDAGSTPAGRPFFVMELVAGVPLTQYCDEKRLTPAQRIDLFLPVCRAIQHAHQKGIIHRDIKPTNVLVGLYDGAPVPKVIDFGVAKATGRAPTEDPDLTALGMVVGTLQYMSPEQAETDGQDVDTRSDVYSLGVLLYELLTGSTPVEKEKLRDAAMAEALKVIREQDPPRPSTRLNQTATLAAVAATRGTEPARLTGIIRGELDWIVMKALEKDRNRRYDSANSFVADLLRYQADEPVEAHPPSLGYRLTKTFRRHRAGLITTAAIVTLLLAGAGISTWQAVRATRAEHRGDIARRDALDSARRANDSAAAERSAREVAQQRLDQVQKANGVFASIFQNLDPRTSGAGGPTLQQQLASLLKTAADGFDGAGATDRSLVARTQLTLGIALDDLGHPRDAVPVLQKAYANQVSVTGEDSDGTMDVAAALAAATDHAGDLPGSIKLWNQIIDRQTTHYGKNDRHTVSAMEELADDYIESGHFTDAVTLLEKAVAAATESAGADNQQTLSVRDHLAEALRRGGRPKDAVQIMIPVADAAGRTLGKNHIDTLTYNEHLANDERDAGDPASALPILEQVTAQMRKQFGSANNRTNNALSVLASVYDDVGRYADAEKVFKEVLTRDRELLGPDHRGTIIATGNLAVCYMYLGDHQRALPLLEQVARFDNFKSRPDDPELLGTLATLGMLYCDTGQPDKGVKVLEDVVSRERRLFGPTHHMTLIAQNGLGLAYQNVGRINDAIDLFRQTLQQRTDTLGPDHPQTLDSINNLACALSIGGDNEQAMELYKTAIEKFSGKLGPDHPKTLNVQTDYALACFKAGETERASTAVAAVVDGYHRLDHGDSAALVDHLLDVANRLSMFSDFDDAVPLVRECLEARRSADPENWKFFYTEAILGNLLAHHHQQTEALSLLRDGFDGMQKRADQIPLESDEPLELSRRWLCDAENAAGNADQAVAIAADEKAVLLLRQKRREAIRAGNR